MGAGAAAAGGAAAATGTGAALGLAAAEKAKVSRIVTTITRVNNPIFFILSSLV
jgi:hypothetical protein